MRIRRLREKDRPRVREVYDARARASAGLMERSDAYWRHRWRDRRSRGPALVAEDRRRIVGYAMGALDEGVTSVHEIVWRPEYDGAEVGPRLLEGLLRGLERSRPLSIAAFEMAGSPALPIVRAAFGPERPPNTVFMAGVVDARALMRDAIRVLRRRRARGLRLRIDGDTAIVGRGPATATVSMTAGVLLGLLLGTRDFDEELRGGRARVAPRTADALRSARAAFPPRRFWIADAW